MPSGVVEKKEFEVSTVNGEKPELFSKNDSKNQENTSVELTELRKILVQSEEVAEVLPKALKKRAEKDNQLAEATLPLVEANIRESVQRNPKILAEAIFPIIGPAIRKAIAEALGAMVQSLNQALEHSLTPQGMKWRVEAWKTGKPFGEVVLLNTLLYRVEQVFLIHKETGILLQHVSVENDEMKDAEMVSAMLTAIQDFVQDSFKTSDEATLDYLKIRDLSVWIEHSPDAIVAAVIRGNAPLNLRGVLIEAIEKVQFEYEDKLEEFEGETKEFEKSRPILNDCLRLQVSENENTKERFFTPFNILTGVLSIMLIVGGFFFVRDYWRWSNYLERLRNESGIVVTESDRGLFKHRVEGLRDELAVNPETLLPEFGYQSDDVEMIWKNYQDLSPQFVLTRAQKILNPPDGTEMTLENGILTVKGNATNEWFLEARNLSQVIAGVKDFKVAR